LIPKKPVGYSIPPIRQSLATTRNNTASLNRSHNASKIPAVITPKYATVTS